MAEGATRADSSSGAGATGLRPDQLRAVEAPGGVAVVAGAGTGKTHMLAHRFLKHVSDGLDPLAIVAVTFTDRAAAELRSRIRSLLGASLPDGSRARLTVEAAQISTMHALAQRICREFPEQAGVAPDFTILDDLEGGMWLTERIESALAAVPSALFEAMPYRSVKEAIRLLLDDPISADAAFSHPVQEWPALVEAARATALAQLTGTAAWREAVGIVRTAIGEEGDRRESTRRQAALGLAQLSLGESAEGLRTISSLNLVGGSRKAFPAGDFNLLGDALKHLREAVRGALAAGLVDLELGEVDERLAVLLPELHGAYNSTRERLESEKRARRVLDFSDLEVHALRALADDEVVAHYRARWRALLVDEFQDTNAVQAKILDALAGGMTVTVVGDEKQSIYGFRGAKAEVFELYRRRIVAQGGQEVVLSESFRSHAGLLADLNATFAPLLADRHQELIAIRTARPGAGPFTSLSVITGGGSKAARQLSEARALGAAIKRLVDEGTAVHDKTTGELRPVRFADVAVLARGWQALGVYGEVLPALGVPAVHTGGGNLLAMREVKDGINLLRAVNEPTDDVALVALLRSPYFAVDDVSLYQLAARRAAATSAAATSAAATSEASTGAAAGSRKLKHPARVSLWETLESQPELPDALGHAREVIASLLARGRSLAPSALLQAADALTGHSAVLAGLPGGRRRLADFGGLIDLVRRMEAGSEDLFTVWRRLRQLLAAEVEVRRPDLAAAGAVTLLTIHSSKGLEWPVVAVADLERREPSRRVPLLLDEDLGVAVLLEDDEGAAAEPALYKILRGRAAARLEQESRRLLYVALTRARDHLLLSAAAERGGALDVLEPGLLAGGIVRQVVEHDPALAIYPAHAPQLDHGAGTEVEEPGEDALRLVEPVLDPRREQGGESGVGGAADLESSDDAWSATLDLVATLDDTWQPIVDALVAAGVAPPALELAGRWLVPYAEGDEGPASGARPSLASAGLLPARYMLLAWRTRSGLLVVTDVATGAADDGPVGSPAPGAAARAVVELGTMTISRRPHGPSPGAEVARVWLLPIDPLSEPAQAAHRIRAALSAVDDKAGG